MPITEMTQGSAASKACIKHAGRTHVMPVSYTHLTLPTKA